MYLIAGLGNPGRKYTYTRHNVGFMVISDLAQKLGITKTKERFNGLIAETMMSGKKVILCEPLTYMNLSGDCIAQVVRYFNIPYENILIIYDDFIIPLGDIRVRKKGSPGGQNGMKSIVYSLDSTDIPRIRVGTGPVPRGESDIDFVLTPFTKSEEPKLDEGINKAIEAAEMFIADGIDSVMNKFNKKITKDDSQADQDF